MKLVKQNYPNVRLAILGDGEDYMKLSKLTNKLKLGDNIDFLGKP